MADNRGGKRAKGGRPRNNPPTKLRGVYITDEQAKLLRMWGRGDASAGLRWLIDSAALLIRKMPKQPLEEKTE
jgi:hypothetical protein